MSTLARQLKLDQIELKRDSKPYLPSDFCQKLELFLLRKFISYESVLPFLPIQPSLSNSALATTWAQWLNIRLQQFMSHPCPPLPMLHTPPKLMKIQPWKSYQPQGAKGAPWPPRITSSSLKLPIVLSLVLAATVLRFRACTVILDAGQWKMVWPCKATKSIFSTLFSAINLRIVSEMKREYCIYSCLNCRKEVVVMVMVWMCVSTSGGQGKVWADMSEQFHLPLWRWKWQQARSTPSREVPLIMPMTQYSFVDQLLKLV